MILRSRVGGRRRLRLWHLSVAVLVAALAFGAIRSLVRESSRPVAAVFMASAAVGVSFALIRLGRAVAGRAMAALKGWGVRRGGVVGFGAWVAGIGVEAGFVLASIVIGPVATVALLAWLLARLDGR